MSGPDQHPANAQTLTSLKLLSLDDGRTKALSALLILREIMYRIGVDNGSDDLALPSKSFDVICSAGLLGGALAIQLGVLSMSITDVIARYAELVTIFETYPSPDHLPLQVQEVFKLLFQDCKNHLVDQAPSSACKVMVVVSLPPSFKPILIRNYDLGNQPDLNGTYDETVIVMKDPMDFLNAWKDALTSSAVSEGLGSDMNPVGASQQGHGPLSNPIHAIWEDVARLYPSRAISSIVSLGTGLAHIDTAPSPLPVARKGYWRIFSLWKTNSSGPSPSHTSSTAQMSIQAEDTAEKFYQHLAKNAMKGIYFRFSVTQGLEHILVESAGRGNAQGNFGEVASHTRTYLQLSQVDSDLNRLVHSTGTKPRLPLPASPLPPISKNPLEAKLLSRFLRESCPEADASGELTQPSRDILIRNPSMVSDFIEAIAPSLLHSQQADDDIMLQAANGLLPPGFSLRAPAQLDPAFLDRNPRTNSSGILAVTPTGAKLHLLDKDHAASLLEVTDTDKLAQWLAHESEWKKLETLQATWPISCMAELLQSALDAEGLLSDKIQRVNALHLLQFYAKKHSILPPSLHVSGIHCEATYPVAGGGFADIYEGRMRGDEVVCLKVMRIFANDIMREVFKEVSTEALLWRQIRHPNILPFLGINTETFSPSFCLVSPIMRNGNILEYLEHNREADKLRMIREVAQGLNALHSFTPSVVHGDIRGANILVKDDGTACIGDFGLAALSETNTLPPTSSAKMRGSLRWLAPELIAHDLPSAEKSSLALKASRDIFAFGCTMLEILTEKIPFEELVIDAAVLLSVVVGKRPRRPESLGSDQDWLWSIATKCWAQNPLERPMIDIVLSELSSRIA